MRFDSYQELADQPESLQQDALTTGDGPERVWAAWAIGMRHGRQAVAALVAPLNVEPEPGVRCHLTVVLAGLGEYSALLTLAEGDPDPEVRAVACDYTIRTAGPARQEEVRAFVARRLELDPAPEPLLRILQGYRTDWPPLALGVLMPAVSHSSADVRVSALAHIAHRFPLDQRFPSPLRERLALKEADPVVLQELAKLAAGTADAAILSAAVRVPAATLGLLQDLASQGRSVDWELLVPFTLHEDPRVHVAVHALCADRTAMPVLDWLAAAIVHPYRTPRDVFASSDEEQKRQAAQRDLRGAAEEALLHWAALTPHPAPSSLSPALSRMLQDVDASLDWLLTVPGDELEDEGINLRTEIESLQRRRNTLLRGLGSSAPKKDVPLFMAIPQTDLGFQSAYDRAAATIPAFIEHVQRGDDSIRSAKLRFRDPDESERLGEDRFAFIWLTGVQYHAAERVFSGTFFEVPPEFQKWHQVGQQLAFDGEDIFDWMVLTSEGRLFGGHTLRVTRSRLPESERADYDRHIGVTAYEPDA